MRRALIGLIMAATVMTPIAAEAQNRGDRERGARAERGEQRSEARQERRQQRQEQQRAEQRQQPRSEQRVERREQRQEQRVERREQRQEQRVERREQRQVRQQQPVQVVQRERRERRNDVDRRNSAYPQAWQGNPNDPMRRHYEQLERRNQYRYGTREQRREVREERREDRRDWRRDRRDDRRDWRDERRDWSRNWNRDWRRDHRYDWSGWRYRNRNIFRGSHYYSPYRNHRYSRFDIGFFLEPLFFSQRYWIGNPYQYRLPPAPPGTQWIRYYNDVLLVDTWSGEVVDVIYDFFW